MRTYPVDSKLTGTVILLALGGTFAACGGSDGGNDGGNGGGPMPPQNDAPSAQITAPQDGGTFAAGAEITFQGSGTDPEDGNLTGASLVWTSSRDGQIGTGTSFTRSDLSEGMHTVTLTATDSDGATGTATVTIEVGTDEAAVEILISDDGGFAFVDPQGRRNEDATVTIEVGQTVRWRYEQSGATNHTVTSGEGENGNDGDGVPEGAEGFDSGALSPGDTFEFTFETAGTWTYFCEFHPSDMFNATVIVEEP